MKKITFLSLAMLLYSISVFAQAPYYGTPFYKEGFDAATLPAGWTQSGLTYKTAGVTEPNTTAWSTISDASVSPPNKRFSHTDAASTYSLQCIIAQNTGLIDTLTSPMITNSETDLICVGFSFFNNPTAGAAWPNGYGYFSFEISDPTGSNWSLLWRSDGQSTGYAYTETPTPMVPSFSGWTTVKVNLPASYNGQNFKVRFCINSEDLRQTAMTLFQIDGLFASKQRTNDAKINSINNFSSTTKGGYLHQAITIQFSNEGTAPISSIDLGYKVFTTGQPDQVVTETYALSTPLQAKQTGSYTFAQKADLSSRRTTYNFSGWVALTGEEYPVDDTLKYTLTNTMTDVPYKAAWLRSGNVTDEWVVVQEDKSSDYPTWSQTIYNHYDTASYCNASNKQLDGDSYYFSRPLYLLAGKTYALRFNTFTESSDPADTNAMKVFLTASLDTSTSAIIGSLLFNRTNINNVVINQSIYVTPTQDSSYYFVFRALCKAQAKPLYIYDLTVKEAENVDALVKKLQTPVNKIIRYTNAEPVTIQIENAGLQSIAGGDLKVYYQLDNNEAVVETISTSLASKGVITHTFASRADMKTLKSYNLKVGVLLDGDEDVSNNALTYKLTPLTVELPYNGSLGANSNNRTYEEDYWTPVDNKWSVAATTTETRWTYGGTGGSPATAVATLYSRPIHVDAGTTCRFNYSVARSSTNITSIPSFQVGVYQKTGNTYNLVFLANDTVVKTDANVYTTYVHDFIPTTSGDYYFGYIVTPSASGLPYNIYLKETNFNLVGDVGISEIVSPTFINNCTATTSITVKVQNYGTNNIYSIPVSYSVNNGTTVKETITFSPALGANQSYTYTFNQTADMSAAVDYALVVYTQLAGDTNLTNDTSSVNIIYRTVLQYGDVNNSVLAGPVGGAPRMGLSSDGSAFVSFWRTTPADSTAAVPFKHRYNLFTQYLDPRGVVQWENDLKISNNDRSYNIPYASTMDHQDNYIVAVSNITGYEAEAEIRVSKINKNKEYLFGETGKQIWPSSTNLYYCRDLKVDSKGDIYAALGSIGTKGSLLKISGETGEIISSVDCNVITMEFDKNDNLHAVWQDDLLKFKLQVYNTDLIPLHDTSANVCTASISNGNSGAKVKMTFDKSGGVWVCYYSQQAYNQTHLVQYIDNNFVPKLGVNGVPVSDVTTRHRSDEAYIAYIEKEDVLAVAFNEISATGVYYYYIKGQKIKNDGTLILGQGGTDIITPSRADQTQDISTFGLYCNDSILALNYIYWTSGAATKKNIATAFYDLDFDIANMVKVDFAKNQQSPEVFYTASDNYGIYSTWKSSGSTSGALGGSGAQVQHIYFDQATANKLITINVKSKNPDFGYATGGGLLNIGDTAKVEAFSIPGNEFVEWQENGLPISSQNPYKFAVAGSITLTAVFKAFPTYTITATAGTGGTITPSGEIEVPQGSDKIFIFTPNTDFILLQVLIDGENDTNAVRTGEYTFTNVTQAHTIQAIFKNLDIKIVDNSTSGSIFTLSPNPVKSGTNFVLHTNLKPEELSGMTIRLYDMNGRLQMNSAVNKNLTFTAPNIPGIYVLQITSNQGLKKEIKLVITQ